MGKSKKPAPDPYRADLFRVAFCLRPLFGLNRLVKLAHRKRSGVLYCDNVMCIATAMTFSQNNTQETGFTISHTSPAHGVIGEPRFNVPNEATHAEMQRFHDDGTEVVFTFTPKAGRTFEMESDMYKAFDAGHRYGWGQLPDGMRIARLELALDISAYLRSGYSYSDSGETPRCEFIPANATNGRRRAGPARARELAAVPIGPGLLEWRVDDVVGGSYRMAWEIIRRYPARSPKTAFIEKLAAELGINPRLAKDLHNFVMICHYYVAGYRSLNKIGPEMMTDKTALRRSIGNIEEAIGTKLVLRTKGRGLIQISPSGEAVLDWWSQFYMRWTPITPILEGLD